MAHERNCTICKTEYEYCPRCRQYADMPTWKLIYCTENCKDIYTTVNKFAFGHITKSEAIEQLKNKDLSKKDNYPNDIKTVLSQIFENNTEVEISEPIIEIQEKTINKKKFGKKKNVNED